MSYLIKEPKLLALDNTFLFNKLETVKKIFQREVDLKEGIFKHEKFKGHSKRQEEMNIWKFSKPKLKPESVNPQPVYNCYGPFLANG
eukprot:104578-Ditylum_brightwellii.AAC.1